MSLFMAQSVSPYFANLEIQTTLCNCWSSGEVSIAMMILLEGVTNDVNLNDQISFFC